MTVPAVPKRPSRDEFSGDYEQDLDPLLGVIGDAQEALINAAAGVVTPYFKTSTFKHGTEQRVRTPLPKGMKCTAIAAVKCIGIYLTADGRPTTATYAVQVLGNPFWRSLGRTQDDGEVVGITVQYAPPLGAIELRRTAAYSLPYNALTSTPYDTVIRAQGALSYSSPNVTCAVAGVVFAKHTAYVGQAAGGYREGYVRVNGVAAPYYAYSIEDTTGGATPYGAIIGGEEITVAAGNTLDVAQFQVSTGLAPLLMGSSPFRFNVRYIAPDPATTARVTLVYYGE